MTGIAILLLCTTFSRPAPAAAADVDRTSPRLAVTLSLVPGGGQAYNGRYAKAALMFGTGAGLAAWRLGERDPGTKEKLSWWLVGLYIYNLLDAYVDAHLAGFDAQTEGSIIPEKYLEKSDTTNVNITK